MMLKGNIEMQLHVFLFGLALHPLLVRLTLIYFILGLGGPGSVQRFVFLNNNSL